MDSPVKILDKKPCTFELNGGGSKPYSCKDGGYKFNITENDINSISNYDIDFYSGIASCTIFILTTSVAYTDSILEDVVKKFDNKVKSEANW